MRKATMQSDEVGSTYRRMYEELLPHCVLSFLYLTATSSSTAGRVSRQSRWTHVESPQRRAVRTIQRLRSLFVLLYHRSEAYTMVDAISMAMLYTSLSTAENHAVSQKR